MPTEVSWRMKITDAVFAVHGWSIEHAGRRTCPRRRSSTCSTRRKDEKVVVRYRHERGENSYVATFEGVDRPTSSGGTGRRSRSTSGPSSRSTWSRSRAPPAAAGGCGPRSSRSRSTTGTSADVAGLSVTDALDWAAVLADRVTERERTIARQVLKEIVARLGFLVDVGLDYLTLDRASVSLSGGEAQRIRLATQIGTTLMGVLYILDEPSIGLHQRDNAKLIATLTRLRDLGNTVLVVEHDEETIRTADWVIDIGPGAGEHGGAVIANGPLEAVLGEPRSITGAFLRGDRSVAIPAKRRRGNGKHLVVKGAREHNLRDVDVRFPLGTFIAVTGVSGSGKSTLVDEVLYRALARDLTGSRESVGAHDAVEGVQHIDKIIEIDQSPIGRTPRSNPATYVGLFGPIRELFAGTPEARVRGYQPGRFSFNVKGGRCENCKGDGIIKIEMQFLPGRLRAVRGVQGQALRPRGARDPLQGPDDRRRPRDDRRGGARVLRGRAQRQGQAPDAVRRRARLRAPRPAGDDAVGRRGAARQARRRSCRGGRPARRSTCSTSRRPGLHFADVDKLLQVLHRLVETGNTVLVIEHNLDVIKTADWIVDLGPEGGHRGGRVIAEGTPEQVADDRGFRDRRVPRPRAARRAARAAERRDVRGGGGPARRSAATAPRAGPGCSSRRASASPRRGQRRASGPADGHAGYDRTPCPRSTSRSSPTPPRPSPATSSTCSAAASRASAAAPSRSATRTSRWSSGCSSPRPRPSASTSCGSCCSTPTARRSPARPAASWPTASPTPATRSSRSASTSGT